MGTLSVDNVFNVYVRLLEGIQKCYEEKPVVFNYFKKSQFNLVLFQTPLP